MLLHREKTKRSEARYRVYFAVLVGGLFVGGLGWHWLAAHPVDSSVRSLTRRVGTILTNPLSFERVIAQQTLVAELPLISVDLAYDDSYTLQQQRQRALDQGRVAASKEDFVPAMLTYEGEPMPIELRLKPGPVAALTTDQWPYQVEIENDDRPLGIKRFSLYPPADEFFVNEQLWLNHLRAEGLMARRTQLVNVSLNGSAQGVFALEDEFSKEWIKASDRPEGLFLQYVEGADATATVRATRPGHIEKYVGLQRQEEGAIAQLAAFSAGQLSAGSVFDLEATAKYLAIASLWPEESALHSARAYFYYNPVTARLEPVGYHYLPNALPEDAATPELSGWIVRLLKDAEFVALYQKERQRLSSQAYLAELEEQLAPDLASQMLLLLPMAAKEQDDVWDALQQRAETSERWVEIAQALPLNKIVAQGRLSSGELMGVDGRSLRDPTLSDLLATHSFLVWDEATQTLSIKSGSWSVDGDLIVPTGISLVVDSFAQLSFDEDALLLSRGPLRLLGDATNPIKLVGKEEYWGGIELWSTKGSTQEPAELRHVLIQNTAAGVLAYHTPISVANTQIVGSTARDGLKLIGNEFSIVDSLFQNLDDDAIDTEGANGKIENTRFKTLGGDGIDLSASKVSVRQVWLHNVEDKGFSVGQNSQLTAEDVVVEDAASAVASLDGSTATITRLQGSDLYEAGLLAYRERLGFSGSSVSASEVRFEESNYEAIAQSDSTITLEGDTLVGNPQSDYLLYQVTGVITD